MNDFGKLNCSIIKDLLPSYLDDICTPDTKTAVEEHLSKCGSCRSLAALMRETAFTSERMEAAEIDFMKKTKRHFLKKGSVGSILPAVFVLLGLFTSIRSYNSSAATIHIYYLILPCLLAATKALCPSPALRHQIKRSGKIMTGLAILLTCWSVFIVGFAYNGLDDWLRQGYGLFHLKPEQLGPFLHWQLMAVLCYLTILYLAGIYHSICGKPFRFISMSICLTCGFIILGEDLTLKCLSDASSGFRFLIELTIIFLLEGLAVTLLAGILEKWKQHRILY